MKPYPTVSLIISTYNWPEALHLSLNSVSHQSVMPTEVIVADDGSRDDTRQLVESMQKNFPCPLIHVWHEDIGFRLAAIRNRAIAMAKGDYVIQCDGDIILNKQYVNDHLSFATQGCFTSGSRMPLSEAFSKKVLDEGIVRISPFDKGVGHFLNGFRCGFLRNYYRFIYKKNSPYYVKGCNMAFWRKDLIAVNGYNEDITGWGAEDSEIAVRLLNSGIRRQFLKFGAVEYHIYHKFNERDKEDANYEIMRKTIDQSVKRCENGLSQYL